MISATEIHAHLLELQAEHVLASIEGLAVNSAYMADLDGEIEATARAYVGAAVTETRPSAPSSPGRRSAEDDQSSCRSMSQHAARIARDHCLAPERVDAPIYGGAFGLADILVPVQ